MINLPTPDRTDAEADLRKALVTYVYKGEQKGYAASDAEIAQLLALYDAYDSAKAVASEGMKGATMPAALKRELDRAYDLTQKNRKLKSIRTALFKGVELCPVCGINTADELDHYLPRTAFKPLAVYIRNLVPLCHDCNGIKLAGFGGGDDGVHFVHAYFDVLPDTEFVKASVALVDDALVVAYFIDEAAGFARGLAPRLSEQMRKLQLTQRYRAELNTYLSGHAVSLHLQYETGGQAAVAKYLRLQAKYETKAPLHRNHWRPVLLKALADLDAFVAGGFQTVLPMDAEMLQDLKALSKGQ